MSHACWACWVVIVSDCSCKKRAMLGGACWVFTLVSVTLVVFWWYGVESKCEALCAMHAEPVGTSHLAGG